MSEECIIVILHTPPPPTIYVLNIVDVLVSIRSPSTEARPPTTTTLLRHHNRHNLAHIPGRSNLIHAPINPIPEPAILETTLVLWEIG